MAANVIEIMPGVWQVQAPPMPKDQQEARWAKLKANFEVKKQEWMEEKEA